MYLDAWKIRHFSDNTFLVENAFGEHVATGTLEECLAILRVTLSGNKPSLDESIASYSVTDLRLSNRARRCLAEQGIETLGQLHGFTDAELLRYPSLGRGTLREIRAAADELIAKTYMTAKE